MDTDAKAYCYDGEKPLCILKWKIRAGSQLFYNSTILSYRYEDVSEEVKEPYLKYKSHVGGTVLELLASEGDVIQSGMHLLKVQPCTHPVIMKDLCAECGQDLRHLDRENFEKLTAANTFSMVHVVPELRVSVEQAEKLGKDDENRLLKDEKLVLLVDLDQTLIHTTNDFCELELPEVYHFRLYGPHSPFYHTKLRPGARTFLKKMSELYELHICTFGARLYAHKIAEILDSDSKLFSHRILSRDECFDATSKTGNLKALFPRGDSMVCIIDDREDVWNYAPNVIHVKPFNYFRNTGDINAPPPSNFAVNSKEVVKMKPVEVPQTVMTNADVIKEHVSSSKEENGDGTKKPIENNALISDVESQVQEPEVVPPLKEPLENEVSDIKSTEASVQNSSQPGSEKVENNCDTDNKTDTSCKSDTVHQKIITEKKIIYQKNLASKQNETGENKSAAHEENDKDVEYDEFGNCYRRIFDEQGNKTDKYEHDPFSDPNADDYLLYLEDILRTVHKNYYEDYKQMKMEKKPGIPDLKIIVPKVRRKVLKGVNLVFSSIIPTNCVPETSKYWTVAESLGARVSRELILDASAQRTTHVVASKFGTAKVNAARRRKYIRIVSLDWLLCCSERWEHADERLFPLTKESDDKSNENSNEYSFYDPGAGKPVKNWPDRHPNLRKRKYKNHPKSEEEIFSERIFVEAGLSLSQEEIDDMDREVEEACSEESDEGNSPKEGDSSEASSDESLSSGDYPKGWKRPRMEGTDLENDRGAGESSDADTIGSVDEEIADAVKQEFGNC